jgi:LuxR family maltose regulon positive regulatory protein
MIGGVDQPSPIDLTLTAEGWPDGGVGGRAPKGPERGSPTGGQPGELGVAREALVGVLHQAPDAGVTLISAPPGSGKTFLLREWLRQISREVPVAEVTVARGETDPQRFWLSLLAAITAAVGRADGPNTPTAVPSFEGAVAVERVLGELEEAPMPLVVVIDDLHELDSRAAIGQLEQVLERLPDGVRIVLSTRRDPDLHLHRLRVAGRLVEVRGADLQFDPGETDALLRAAGVVLEPDVLAVLHARTEGWAAGLRLAALSLAGHPDPGRFVAAFSGTDRTVAEYLLVEMLERQPPEVRDLLLRTSILENVNGPLADLLTGRSGAQRVLERLEDSNSFVFSLDPERVWFRYHHLFADLLRLELRRGAPDLVAELHRAAAGWFADHDQPVPAMHHAQAAEDWDIAARLLVDNALRLTLSGDEGLVHEILSAFPSAVVESNPELIGVVAGDRIGSGALSDAAAYLNLADARSSLVPLERRSRLAVGLAATRLSLARRRGDFTDVRQQVDLLSRPVEVRSTADVELSSELRAFALLNLGAVEMWSLLLDDAQEHLAEGAAVARRVGLPYLEVSCLAHLGFAAHGESFAKARETCRAAITLAEANGWGDSHVVAPALAALGGTLVFSGEFAEAERLLARAQTALRPEIEPATSLLFHLSRGMLDAGLGRSAAALAHFRDAEQMQTLLVTQHALAVQVRSFRVAMQLRLGQLEDAAETADVIEAEDEPWGESLAALAAVRQAQERPEEALAALGPVFAGAVPVIHAFTTVHAQMVAALAWVDVGDRRASEAVIEDALELAEPDRLVLPFLIAGGRALLERHPRHATAHAQLITEILDILDGGGESRSDEPAELTEPLSRTELRVLRYLPSNLSAPELASELYLSPNTVKTHMRHIYAKLGVHTRTEAVRQAREFGLLGRSGRDRS